MSNGSLKTADTLKAELDACFEVIQNHATDAALSENSQKKISKAKKVTDSMVATLSFFWHWVDNEIERLKLTDASAHLFKQVLLLIAYVDLQIPKSRNAKEKRSRQQLYEAKINELDSNEHWQTITIENQRKLMESAKKCAAVFQRSSSCVEGRNGQLSLMHHSRRAINAQRLSSLTVVHNYFVRRPNNTTAAERFFEQKHDNLFLWLLDRIDCPPLPAQKRAYKERLRKVA